MYLPIPRTKHILYLSRTTVDIETRLVCLSMINIWYSGWVIDNEECR